MMQLTMNPDTVTRLKPWNEDLEQYSITTKEPVKPLCIDLCCGLGGWAEGFLAEGYQVIGFDIERHVYGEHRYPGELVLQDVLTLDGRQFPDAAVIVASPPCPKYSYMAQPWRRAKVEAKWQRWFRDSGSPFADRFALNDLFDACFRIANEAGVPLVLENVKGAQPWVGRAKWHYGSFYLWGDVPALMPSTRSLKVAGFNFHQYEKTGQPGGSAAVKATPDGLGGYGGGFGWDDTPLRRGNSHSPARKAASALIAKIPFELSSYIARVFKPS